MSGWGETGWGVGPWGLAGDAGGALVVSNVAPGVGISLTPSGAVQLDVTSDALVAQLIVTAEHSTTGLSELVFDGTNLATPYRNVAAVAQQITGGIHLAFARTGGWPGDDVTIRVFATDLLGAYIAVAYTWVVARQYAEFGVAPPPVTDRGDPLGYGLIRPLRRTSRGDFAAGGGDALVAANVRTVLETPQGELPWRPDFGTAIDLIRHRIGSAANAEVARLSVSSALAAWVPQVESSEVEILGSSPNELRLRVSYLIRDRIDRAGVVEARL